MKEIVDLSLLTYRKVGAQLRPGSRTLGFQMHAPLFANSPPTLAAYNILRTGAKPLQVGYSPASPYLEILFSCRLNSAMAAIVVDRHRTFRFNADSDLDPNPCFTHVGKSNNFFSTFIHSSTSLHCLSLMMEKY